MFNFSKFVIIGVVLSSVTSLQAAEKIPYSVIIQDYESCLKSTTFPKQWAPAYCLCASTEIRNTLSLKEYLSLSSEALGAIGDDGKIEKHKALAIEGLKKIAATCQKELAKEM